MVSFLHINHEEDNFHWKLPCQLPIEPRSAADAELMDDDEDDVDTRDGTEELTDDGDEDDSDDSQALEPT